MNPPLTFPDVIEELDRWERGMWNDRIRDYQNRDALCVEHVRYGHLWRVGIFEPNGRLIRFFYGQQAKILVTLWPEVLKKHKTRADLAEHKSTLPQTSAPKSRTRSKGRNKGGDQRGNL